MSDTIEKIGMKPPHVGGFIRDEILNELGLSITKAATALNVRRATLSDLVNEKTSLTPEMALRIEKAFGVNMDILLKIQAWYDTVTMRQHADQINVQRYSPVNEH
ncbi:HigA family addiction module antitoxin [Phyllobacterium sp. YR531]|uniref:HigA family addiction module antitoxin n=1 Tax=Phyllobacterium sp. YR531 TaxID=1144343 RepID=UPI00026FB206|nr:HigA family addiction module antitoxin [Phyllobacterium sp. YR531]EJN05446.1 addiction module antidote protein, HigA family [Phyllobacterium sp. YR531]